jgi:hypothetical protein
MLEELNALHGRGELRPVQRRGVWIAWGLALQAIGVGIPVTVAMRLVHGEGVSSGFTHYTVRLVWHEMLASRADLALVALGVGVFAAGAVVLARPFVTRRSTLFVAVPVAATVGFSVFGVIALVCAALIALAGTVGDGGGGTVGDGGAPLDGLSSWTGRGGPRNRRK